MQKNDDISALLWLVYEKERASISVPDDRKQELLNRIKEMFNKKE